MASRPAGASRLAAPTRRVLFADRDERRRTRFQLFFDRRGYGATFADGSDAIEGAGPAGYDVVFCDLEALALAEPVALGEPYVVLVAAAAERARALDAVASVASIDDCVVEPAADADIELVLRRAERCVGQKMRAERARRAPGARAPGAAPGLSGIVGESESMARVFDLVERVARHDASVLITGDSGTGKELVARAIHDQSARDGAFVAVNCGAIPGSLLESELFGYRRGAFTDASRDKKGLIEEAHGGTLFLDEIGEMPLELQVVLLRVLQEGEVRPLGASHSVYVNVRIVAATVRDLAAEAEAGTFRQDLFFRLNVLPVHVPPLRERKQDIPVLARHFLQVFSERHGAPGRDIEITDGALARLTQHSWPGNVRELENTIERAVVLSDGGRIDERALGELSRPGDGDPLEAVLAQGEFSIKRATRAIEEALIRRALDATGGNRTNAAKLLEISHRALLYKIKEYGL